MRRTGVLWGAVAAITIVISGCSNTEGTKPPSSERPAGQPGAVGTGGAGADVKSDDDFVRDVSLKNMAEIELSRMALEKASSPALKAYAQTIVEDHGAAGDKLKSAVSGESIEWPSQLDDKHKKAAGELRKEQGADFDRDFVKAMIESHQDLAAKLESRLDVQSLSDWKTAAAGRAESNKLPEPKTAMTDVQVRPAKSEREITMRINQWAADMYPVAQKHLDTARTLENATKKPSIN
jgi:putative membrane protein